MTTQNNLIVLTDSRGRGLKGYLETQLIDFTPVIKLLPGRSLQAIAIIAKKTLPKYDQTNFYCIIHAGICSFTIRTAVGHPTSLRYPFPDRDHKLREIIDTIAELKSIYKSRINICTIAPASLVKFFQLRHPGTPLPRGLEQEQNSLIEDIHMINSYIKQLNSDHGNPNINIGARFFSHSKKKSKKSKTTRRVTKFKDTHLVDGVHFSTEIRDISFRLIKTTASSELQKLEESSSSSSSSSESESSSLFTLDTQDTDD